MFVHERSRSLVLRVRDPLALRDMLPHATRLIDAPEGNLVVRHNLETTRVLRNLGFETPSPIRSQYSWPGRYRPFPHQEVMVDALTMNPYCFNLSDMGTGKTYAALWAADYLMSIGVVKRWAIIVPLSTLETIWTKDIFDILMHRNVAVVHGSQERRAKMMNTDADIYLINHDGIGLEDVAREIKRRKDIQGVILDEASIFRNSKTKKYKFLRWTLEKKEWFWAITGTPNPNGPTDAWAMARIINPTAVPKFFGHFKVQTMHQVSSYKWVPKKGAEQIVFTALQPAVRFRKDDCMDLPAVTTVNRQVKLSAEQQKHYDDMKAEMVMSWSGGTIDAVNAADKITKLRQILCGVVKDPETGGYIELDFKPRLNELIHVAKQAAAKVIIVVPFKGITYALERELSKHASIGVLNGDVSQTVRNRTIQAFKTTRDPEWLICHPKVMAHGLNLVEADMTIFYSPIYSNDEYRQVIERNNRAGQTRSMTVVRLGAHPLEWGIYGVVDNKGITQDNILKLYHKVII